MRLLRRSSRRADDQQQQSTRGRQAVVRAPRQRSAATDNATRRGVQHGAPETLPGGQRHRAPLIPVRVVLPAKGDSLAVVVDQAVVAECDAMRVAAPGRYAREFAVNAVVGGVLVLLPLYLAVLVMLKGMQSVVVLVRPLAALFPETVPAENALALLAVLFICFVVGAAVRTRAGRVVRERVETSFFGRLPGYALFRGFTQRLAGGGDQNMWKPALPKSRMLSSPRSSSRNSTTAASQCSCRQYQHRSPELSTFSAGNACISSTFHSLRLSNPSRGGDQGRKIWWQRWKEWSCLRDAMPNRLLEDPGARGRAARPADRGPLQVLREGTGPRTDRPAARSHRYQRDACIEGGPRGSGRMAGG